MQQGSVKLVHELPNWTFSGVDGKIYVLVYDHKLPQHSLRICNHRLRKPDVILLPPLKAQALTRWDFGFVQAAKWLQLARRKKDAGWKRVADASEVCRGTVDSPVSSNDVLHTTNLTNIVRKVPDNQNAAEIRPGDIVMSRVGRRSAFTPTLYRGTAPANGSDCILRIRPSKNISALELLLALRTVVSWPYGSSLIERGVGAKYVTIEDLQQLHIPLGLGNASPELLASYKKLISAKRWNRLLIVEEKARRLLVEQ